MNSVKPEPLPTVAYFRDVVTPAMVELGEKLQRAVAPLAAAVAAMTAPPVDHAPMRAAYRRRQLTRSGRREQPVHRDQRLPPATDTPPSNQS